MEERGRKGRENRRGEGRRGRIEEVGSKEREEDAVLF